MADRWTLDDLSRAWAERGLDRRELLRLLAAGGGAAAMAALLARPAGAAPAGQDAAAAQVSIEWRKPQTLGPLFSTAGYEQQVERAILGSLVRMSDALQPTGDLAETIDVSPDATQYTFHLRANAVFSDGTPLTSADVVFTFTRALDPAVGSIWAARLGGIQGAAEFAAGSAPTVTGIAAPDPQTVTFTLTAPDAAFLVILADFCGLGILPAHILESVAPAELVNNPFNLAPNVGAGAFTFVEYATDQYLHLRASDTYWGGRPAVSDLYLRIINAESAVGELEQGGLDLIAVAIQDIERLQGTEGVTVVSVPSPSMDSISCNLANPIFQDKRIRQAMMYGIDRAGIVREIYQDNAIVRNSPIFGPEWMGTPEGLNEYAHDPDTARQLLADAGWDSGREVQMIYNPAGTATFNQMIPIIQAQLGEIGMKIVLQQYDNAGINQRIITDHDYEIYIGGGGVYGADPNVSSRYYLTTAHSPGGANTTWYTNPAVDDLYAQGRQAGDQAARRAVYVQLAQLMNDECPSVFLWSPNTIFAFRNRLLNFVPPSYVDNRLWQSEQWAVGQ